MDFYNLLIKLYETVAEPLRRERPSPTTIPNPTKKPRPREAPDNPLKPTPGIHPEPKGKKKNKDVELFKKTRMERKSK